MLSQTSTSGGWISISGDECTCVLLVFTVNQLIFCVLYVIFRFSFRVRIKIAISKHANQTFNSTDKESNGP